MADTQGFEQAAIDRILAMVDPMSDAAASMMGLPPGGKRYTQQEIDDDWNWSPIADPGQRVQAMLQLRDLGKTDEEITDAIYPKRRRIIETSHPKLADRIAFAKQMDARMQKLSEEMAAQMAPEPSSLALPAPTAPEPQTAAPVIPEPMAPAPEPAPQPSLLDQPLSSMWGG